MKKKTKLIWRLREQPTPESLQGLVLKGILTKDEAREILFSLETEEARDKKSLESEIKFLRELVEKLSQNNSRIVEVIREVERPWRAYPWYQPYSIWCSATTDTTSGVTGGTLTGSCDDNITTSNFSNITTF